MLTSMRVAVFSASRRQCRNMSSNNLSKIDKSKFPIIKEDELEEKFISGWGPGGQSVNKSVNCCQLKHKPTGIIVKVHHSRSLEQNRSLAREIIATKVDNLINGDKSVENQKKRNALHKIATKESLAEKRRQMKQQHNKLLEQEKVEQQPVSEY